MRNGRALLIAAFASAALLLGCSGWESATPAPSRSDVLVVGTVQQASENGPISEFRLADGRTLSFDLSVVRPVHLGGGEPLLLVSGRDENGEWMALIGHQDGTPDGCHVLNEAGFDFGASIAIAGVQWPKAPTFVWTNAPGPGSLYPGGTRFCLDDTARVSQIIPG